MIMNELKQRKIAAARRLFNFKLDRYVRWHVELSREMINDARDAAARKYGIKPTDIP